MASKIANEIDVKYFMGLIPTPSKSGASKLMSKRSASGLGATVSSDYTVEQLVPLSALSKPTPSIFYIQVTINVSPSSYASYLQIGGWSTYPQNNINNTYFSIYGYSSPIDGTISYDSNGLTINNNTASKTTCPIGSSFKLFARCSYNSNYYELGIVTLYEYDTSYTYNVTI